jgi:hypothetical protein
MAKQGNPLLRKTAPVEPEILDDGADIIPFNETFPGVPPMSVREKKRLAELETVVTKNFKAFYEVGSALQRNLQFLALPGNPHKLLLTM